MATVKATVLNKPTNFFLKPKGIEVVTKKALNQIADGIHNPKTGHYLNLCMGTLQNGDDPACPARHMHCGLGELYFVVTGKQPEDDHVSEHGVVEEVVRRSTIGELADAAKKKIEKLGFSEDLTDELLYAVDSADFDTEFREILDGIPEENDAGDETTKDFKARARRVAASLRKAAALLPR